MWLYGLGFKETGFKETRADSLSGLTMDERPLYRVIFEVNTLFFCFFFWHSFSYKKWEYICPTMFQVMITHLTEWIDLPIIVPPDKQILDTSLSPFITFLPEKFWFTYFPFILYSEYFSPLLLLSAYEYNALFSWNSVCKYIHF